MVSIGNPHRAIRLVEHQFEKDRSVCPIDEQLVALSYRQPVSSGWRIILHRWAEPGATQRVHEAARAQIMLGRYP